MTPSQLSHELRHGHTPDLKRRRAILGMSFAGTLIGVVVAAYQTGILRRLPDPPFGPFDSTRVNASDYAYKRFQTPDALAMIATYAATAWLAGAGGERRADTTPWLPVAMGAKLVSDVATNLVLAREEWAGNKALCAYCQTASLLSLASLAAALPEVSHAAKRLLGHA